MVDIEKDFEILQDFIRTPFVTRNQAQKSYDRIVKYCKRLEAAQHSVQRNCDHERTLRMPSGKLFCVVCQEYIA